MEPGNVKSEEQLRRQWVNRPASEMYLGLNDWVEVKSRAMTTIEGMKAAIEAFAPFAGDIAVSSTPFVTPDPYAEIVQANRPRHESGKMNKLEARYAAHLELRKTVGEIRDWRFEPMKLRLAKSTFFDVDFLVEVKDAWGTMTDEYSIELHEVKGHWEDDARVKMKVAAAMFPWWTFRGVQWDKEKKDWKHEEFRP